MPRLETLTVLGLVAAGLVGCNPPADPPADPATPASVAAEPSAGPSRPSAYEARALGISLALPVDRSVGECTGDWQSDRPCLTVLGPVQGQQVVLFSLQAYEGALEAVARDQAGFEPGPDGRWMTTFGRFQPNEVERITGPGWTGMRATTTCGISDAETGFHATGGECLSQVVSNGEQSILVQTDGRHGLDDDTAAILSSIRFMAVP